VLLLAVLLLAVLLPLLRLLLLLGLLRLAPALLGRAAARWIARRLLHDARVYTGGRDEEVTTIEPERFFTRVDARRQYCIFVQYEARCCHRLATAGL